MGLSRLFEIKASVIPTEQISIRLDLDLLAYADEVADELGITRTEVLREAVRDGMQSIYAQWQQALENGNKGGKK